MRKTECLGMILAGGQGSRLKALTKTVAKPAVPFGGKYRIIDFPLSNCVNSGINKVGIATQYKPFELHSYLGSGTSWDLDRTGGGLFVLPPYAREKGGDWYRFIDLVDPEYIIILSGDHIYTMNYAWMLESHKNNNADVTIGVFEVPWEEAPRFGIMATDKETGRIVEFQEKPKEPKSNLASMGIYIFTTSFLKKYLLEDGENENSSHDFGNDLIPKMLNDGARMFSYAFDGYWKDVGTIESLWLANMDLLEDTPPFELNGDWKIYSSNPSMPPHYVGPDASVKRAMISEGAKILGEVEHSVIFPGATVGKGAKVTNSVIFPGTVIEDGAVVNYAILAQDVTIKSNAKVEGKEGEISVVAENEVVG